jgi:Ala-tRNA(Pro) deacylase
MKEDSSAEVAEGARWTLVFLRALARRYFPRDLGETSATSALSLSRLCVSVVKPAMPATDLELFALLDSLGIAHVTHAHAPVFTVAEARDLRGSLPGGHTKNLFLKDKKDGLWLVVAREELAVDLKALSQVLGVPRFSFGSAELLMEVLGVPAGSVTPFAAMNDRSTKVRIVLDDGMMALDPLNFHPLRNDRTTAISAPNLLRFLRATGHEPVIVALPTRE